MPTTTFTTRIDKELKSRLERIAKYENRSASFVANRAIAAAVEEREATHDLVDVGLQMIDQGVGMTSKDSVTDWLRADDDAAFPKPDVSGR